MLPLICAPGSQRQHRAMTGLAGAHPHGGVAPVQVLQLQPLRQFSRYPPLTGDYEENLRLADEIDSTAPFQAMIARVRLGGDGLPRWRPMTEED
jgi:hypothetical protein